MKLPSTRTALAMTALFVLGTATACGSDYNSSAAPAATATPAAPAATASDRYGAAPTDAPDATDAPGTSASTVSTATNALGTILVDADGMTLYMFKPDNQGPSTCTEQCAGAWPAVIGPANAGDGVDQAKLGTAIRPDDGTAQVTYNGWPLYHYAQDTAPGDAHGQEVKEAWYVVDPSGAPIGL